MQILLPLNTLLELQSKQRNPAHVTRVIDWWETVFLDCPLSICFWLLLPTDCAPCHRQPRGDRLPDEVQADHSEKREEMGEGERELDQSVSSPATAVRHLDGETGKKRVGAAGGAGDVPNGTEPARWSPETTNLDSAAGEEVRPLIAPPPESVELAVWSPEGGGEPGPAAVVVPQQGPCCRCCRCCQSGRLPAFFSVLASLPCAAAILYGLYFYVPIKPPDCPDSARRIVFTLCCCVVAAVPVLLGMTHTDQ